MSMLYKEAAAILTKLLKRQGGLKTLAYSDSVQHKRSSYALVCETMKYKAVLDRLINESRSSAVALRTYSV
jgi:putative methyltransferase